jgi:hypothetical protein
MKRKSVLPWVAYWSGKGFVAITEWKKETNLTPDILTHEFVHCANHILKHDRHPRYSEVLAEAKRHGELMVAAYEKRRPGFGKQVQRRYAELAGPDLKEARYLYLQQQLVALAPGFKEAALGLRADSFPGNLRFNAQYLVLAAHWHLTDGDPAKFGYPPEEIVSYRCNTDDATALSLLRDAAKRVCDIRRTPEVWDALYRTYGTCDVDPAAHTLSDGSHIRLDERGVIRELVGVHGQPIFAITQEGRVHGKPTGHLIEDRRSVHLLFDEMPYGVPEFAYALANHARPVDLAKLGASAIMARDADGLLGHVDRLYAPAPAAPAPRRRQDQEAAPGMRF